MSDTWQPTTHDEYDRLKGFTVYSSDNEKLGRITAVLHPQSTGTLVADSHYFCVEPGILKKLLGNQEEIFVSEAMIHHIDPNGDKVVLAVTKDRVGDYRRH